ncbi:MAG TPA: PAS domain-containing protein [Candidatus Binatia bacterium]|nr:PAS domain-containing protein [Candidatus Binatia bacterium]
MQIKDLEVFNELPFLFWVKDEAGKYLWGNRVISQLAGQEIVGKTDHELPWAADADALRVADKQVFETAKPRFLHEYVTKPNNITLNVCKWLGDLEDKKRCFGIAFVIE